MADPSTEALVSAFREAERMGNIRRYKERGRHLAALSDEALTAAWTRALTAWAAAPRSSPRDLEDAQAEMDLRGIEAPEDGAETAAALQALRRASQEHAIDMSAEDLEQRNRSLMADIDAELGRDQARN